MKVYIGLGSNIGDRKKNINRAIEYLGKDVEKVSSIYETEPVGLSDGGGKFYNAVAEIDTDKDPEALLNYLEEIERKMGRQAKGVCKSRVIDLDILYYGKEVINTPRLKIPHPKIKQRAFVLEPLKELSRRGKISDTNPEI